MSLFQKKEGNFYLMVAMLGPVTNMHLQDRLFLSQLEHLPF